MKVSTNIVVLYAGSMLLVERINKQGWGKHWIISDKKQKDETDKEAACRIIESELGLKVNPDDFKSLADSLMHLEINDDGWKRIKLNGKKYERILPWLPESVHKATDIHPTIRRVAYYVMTKLPSNKIL